MPTEDRIDQVKLWLEDFVRAGPNRVHVKQDTGWNNNEWYFKVSLYTATCNYTIMAIDRHDHVGYLGCIASCRYPLLGEHWRRGNDLADGPLVKETWEKIKNDIIAYELIKPAPKQTVNTATFENLTLVLKGVLNAIEKASLKSMESSSVITPTSSSAFTRVLSTSGPPLPFNVNRAPIHISPGVKENAIDFLQPILEMVPVEMLPELIASEDDCLSTAAAQCTESGRLTNRGVAKR